MVDITFEKNKPGRRRQNVIIVIKQIEKFSKIFDYEYMFWLWIDMLMKMVNFRVIVFWRFKWSLQLSWGVIINN